MTVSFRGVATVADCLALRSLKYELGGVDASFAPAVVTTVAVGITCLDAVLATALPVTTGAGTATLAQARAQGRAGQDALATTTTALAVISRLRSR
jgi:hypothetical protein